MSKKILECHYCGTIITENDTNCPKCGANCSDIIKEYKMEQAAEQEKVDAENKELETMAKEFAKNNIKRVESVMNVQKKVMPFFFLIPIIMFCVIAFSIFSQFRSHTATPKAKDAVVGELNEKITTDDYTITIDKYEEYEYYHRTFDSCNTKDGYQRIAFHIVLENKKDENVTSTKILKSITLKAGDEQVNKASLKPDVSTCETIQGKEEYSELVLDSYYDGATILPGDKLAGYVGFEVPKDEKKLKFIINDSQVIEIDNPAYSKKK